MNELRLENRRALRPQNDNDNQRASIIPSSRSPVVSLSSDPGCLTAAPKASSAATTLLTGTSNTASEEEIQFFDATTTTKSLFDNPFALESSQGSRDLLDPADANSDNSNSNGTELNIVLAEETRNHNVDNEGDGGHVGDELRSRDCIKDSVAKDGGDETTTETAAPAAGSALLSPSEAVNVGVMGVCGHSTTRQDEAPQSPLPLLPPPTQMPEHPKSEATTNKVPAPYKHQSSQNANRQAASLATATEPRSTSRMQVPRWLGGGRSKTKSKDSSATAKLCTQPENIAPPPKARNSTRGLGRVLRGTSLLMQKSSIIVGAKSKTPKEQPLATTTKGAKRRLFGSSSRSVVAAAKVSIESTHKPAGDANTDTSCDQQQDSSQVCALGDHTSSAQQQQHHHSSTLKKPIALQDTDATSKDAAPERQTDLSSSVDRILDSNIEPIGNYSRQQQVISFKRCMDVSQADKVDLLIPLPAVTRTSEEKPRNEPQSAILEKRDCSKNFQPASESNQKPACDSIPKGSLTRSASISLDEEVDLPSPGPVILRPTPALSPWTRTSRERADSLQSLGLSVDEALSTSSSPSKKRGSATLCDLLHIQIDEAPPPASPLRPSPRARQRKATSLEELKPEEEQEKEIVQLALELSLKEHSSSASQDGSTEAAVEQRKRLSLRNSYHSPTRRVRRIQSAKGNNRRTSLSDDEQTIRRQRNSRSAEGAPFHRACSSASLNSSRHSGRYLSSRDQEVAAFAGHRSRPRRRVPSLSEYLERGGCDQRASFPGSRSRSSKASGREASGHKTGQQSQNPHDIPNLNRETGCVHTTTESSTTNPKPQPTQQALAEKEAFRNVDQGRIAVLEAPAAPGLSSRTHRKQQQENENNAEREAMMNNHGRSYASVASGSTDPTPASAPPPAAAAASVSELDGAAEFLSPGELELIKQALEEADNAESNHQAASASGENIVEAADTGISEEELAAINRAIAEADAAEEAQSLQLATRMQQEEERWEQQHQEAASLAAGPRGNVRTMTRAELRAEEAANVGAYSSDWSPPRHPQEEEAGSDFRGQEEEDELGAAAGFRMNSATEHQWSRRDRNSIVGPGNEVRTKHDGNLDSLANLHRLGLDDDGGSKIDNRAFNSFRQNMKRQTKKGVASYGTGRAGSDSDNTKGGALDAASLDQITRAINAGTINRMNGVVKEGKEAVIYHAEKGEESEGFDVAVKIFKRIQEFRNRGEYVDGDPRFEIASFKNATKRQQLALWTEKEYRNLTRASRSGVPVPTPLLFKENILFMRFMGSQGWPAPQLRELELRKGSSKWKILYSQVMHAIRTLYITAKLVHGDLSEYNVMVCPANLVQNMDPSIEKPDKELQAVLIDFGQAVDHRHPEAERLLERDLERIYTFFSRQEVSVMTLSEAKAFVMENVETAEPT